MAGVIFQKVTLHLAQRLFSADLYLFKGGLRLSAITNALTNNWAVCHLELIQQDKVEIRCHPDCLRATLRKSEKQHGPVRKSLF